VEVELSHLLTGYRLDGLVAVVVALEKVTLTVDQLLTAVELVGVEQAQCRVFQAAQTLAVVVVPRERGQTVVVCQAVQA
jgi:hypothetical protein